MEKLCKKLGKLLKLWKFQRFFGLQSISQNCIFSCEECPKRCNKLLNFSKTNGQAEIHPSRLFWSMTADLQTESGQITEEMFRYILDKVGDISDSALVDELFTEVDVDGNGVIDYDEFAVMVKNYLTEEDVAAH